MFNALILFSPDQAARIGFEIWTSSLEAAALAGLGFWRYTAVQGETGPMAAEKTGLLP